MYYAFCVVCIQFFFIECRQNADNTKEKKTETMVITKKKEGEIPICQIIVNGTTLKQVKSFKYLGTTINCDAKDDKEFNIRIAQAKATFQQMKSVLCNKNIPFSTRYRVLKCYIYSVF